MVVKVVVEGEGGSGVSTRQVKSSVQQLPNISQILFFKKATCCCNDTPMRGVTPARRRWLGTDCTVTRLTHEISVD